MEKEWFDWESWDELDTVCSLFINCTLKRDIGPFKTGKKFDCITVDYSQGFLGIQEMRFQLTLVIGAEIPG
jgi:hypothetical protein